MNDVAIMLMWLGAMAFAFLAYHFRRDLTIACVYVIGSFMLFAMMYFAALPRIAARAVL